MLINIFFLMSIYTYVYSKPSQLIDEVKKNLNTKVLLHKKCCLWVTRVCIRRPASASRERCSPRRYTGVSSLIYSPWNVKCMVLSSAIWLSWFFFSVVHLFSLFFCFWHCFSCLPQLKSQILLFSWDFLKGRFARCFFFLVEEHIHGKCMFHFRDQ